MRARVRYHLFFTLFGAGTLGVCAYFSWMIARILAA